MIEYENLSKINKRHVEVFQSIVRQYINDNQLVLGDGVKKFESKFSNLIGAKYCIGVGSGLDALIIAIKALGLPPRSEIIVSANSYFATVLSIIRAGHIPILVDAELDTFNIDVNKIEESITSNTRAIIALHLYGTLCNIERILEIATKHNLYIIEDACQAHFIKRQKYAGAYGSLGCFSFYPTKILGGLGEGGMIATDDSCLADICRQLRNYGSAQKDTFDEIGYNSRLDELQARFLSEKLEFVHDDIAHKRSLAAIYFDRLKPLEKEGYLILPKISLSESNFHIFPIIVNSSRNKFVQYMRTHNIQAAIHYPTYIPKQKAFEQYLRANKKDYPVAKLFATNEVSLPISIIHNHYQIEYVCKVIWKYFQS